MKLLFISLLFFATLSYSKIKFNHDQTPPPHPQDFLNAYPQLQVYASSADINYDDYQTIYYKMMEVGRNKRKTYDYFMKKSKKIVERLSSHLFVPASKTLLQSPVQMVFVNKKKYWEFSKFFAIRIHENQIQKLQTVLAPFKLQAIRFQPDLENKRIKEKIAQAFSVAKIETNNFLSQNYQNSIKIHSVKQIQVEGFKQYSSSASSEQKQKHQDNSIEGNHYTDKGSKQTKNNNQKAAPKSINLKIIFKLVNLNVNLQNYAIEQQSKISQEQPQIQKQRQTEEAEEQQL